MGNEHAQYQLVEALENEQMEYERRNHSRILRRHIRDAHNPFDVSDNEFRLNFRLNKAAVEYLIENLTPHMEQGGGIVYRIPNHLRILVALHFFATGSYQRSVGNSYLNNMSQSMVSRSVRQVSNCLNRRLLRRWINFPRNDASREDLKASFLHAHQLPHIIGIVDGTHVAIVKPTEGLNEHLFMNRKGYHSLNVQIVCDYRLRIISCNAEFPGSSHDSFIWRTSIVGRSMKGNFVNGDRESRLLGDSGYPCLPWLLGPLRAPNTEAEIRFNNHIKRVRSNVERCIGILKARFRCLLKDRTLHYKPNNAARIIMSCAVLHNIAIHFRVPNPEPQWDPIDLNVGAIQDNPGEDIIWRQEGQRFRQEYIDTYFNHND